jgi:heterodisulfide reductase subunit A-like polyferredoxin
MKRRIQVVICRVCSQGVSVLDVDRLAKTASEAPYVGSVAIVEYACQSKTVASLVEDAKKNEVDRVLIIPCSRKDVSPGLFQAYMRKGKINGFLIETVDLTNEVILPHREDPVRAQEKAEAKVAAAIARLAALEPLERRREPMRTKNVVVIGAGVAGLEAARVAADRGMHTVLIEKTGRSLKVPGVLLSKSKLVRARGYGGNYELTIQAGEKEETLECAAVVVASGGDWSEGKGPLARACKEAMPLFRLKESLEDGTLPSGPVVIVDTPDPKGSAMKAQDFAWDDALDVAASIKKDAPDTDITLVFQEMRVSGLSELKYREAAESGVRFVRYDKRSPPAIDRKDSGKLVVKDLAQDEAISLPFSVLSYASVPANPDNIAIADALRIPVALDGGIRRGSMQRGPVTTPRPGIFVCGSAMFPKTEAVARVEGRAAGVLAAQFVSTGVLEYGGAVAGVTPEKCSACLTCVRTCPYEAPFIGDAGKADIRAQLCQGCGTCAGICPSKAIDIHNYTDEQLSAETATYLRGGF